MKTIIRIRGLVEIPRGVQETLYRLKLRRKYSCVMMKETKDNIGMLKKIRNFVAYGDLDDKTLMKLIEARAQPIPENKNKKLDTKKIFEEIKKDGISKEIKPFFRLHPPRKGIKSKLHFPKGVLGDNGKELNKLIERML